MSFLALSAKSRLGSNNKLLMLLRIINWELFGELLSGIYDYEINGKGGQKPYDSVKMFKSVLLGQWFSLSDAELENSLRVRIDFMMFTDFEDDVPDETTLCRFRNKLIELGLDKVLFAEINRQLEANDLKVEKCHGAVVDATIIESASRPNKVIKSITNDRQEDEKEEAEDSSEETDQTTEIEYSKDPDATWLRKGKQSYYGYKGFITTDSSDGFITNVHVTPANESEVKNLENALGNTAPERVYADKGYASEENRERLKMKGIKDGIMRKAVRNKPLTFWEKLRNKLLSKVRFIVEQAFGTLKRKFKIWRAAYIGLAKVEAQLRLKSICFNLLKAVNKLEMT